MIWNDFLKAISNILHKYPSNTKGRLVAAKIRTIARTNVQDLLGTVVQALFCSRIQEINPCRLSLAVLSLEPFSIEHQNLFPFHII